MFGFGSSRPVPSSIEQLNSQHAALLDGESVQAICHAYGADQVHPDPIGRRSTTIRTREQELSASGAAHLRLAAVRQALGMHDTEFTELPASPTGYTLARTESRLLIFGGLGIKFMGESLIRGIWLQSINHGDGTLTLVFKHGDERVAVTSRREYETAARDFVSAFPDRRAKPRVLHVVGQPTIADF